jgi:uncharacterized protein YmfQ (DUF2313 family)
MDLLPSYYQNSPETVALQSAVESEVNNAQLAEQNLLDQLNVDTATWGIALWEKAFGILPPISETLDTRRARVKSKMRARGVTTVSMIQNVAESFIHGTASVMEHPEKYTFDIQFDATQQIPSNLAGLSAAIDELKPAHLAYAYAYLFISKVMAGAYQTSGTTITIYPYTAGRLETVAKLHSGSGCFISHKIMINSKGSEM